jgi:hypothetical protein
MSFDPPTQLSRGAMTFVRFVVGTNQEPARLQTGVVIELRLLKESGELPDYEHPHVEELFAWINQNLPVPPFAEAQWPRDAISWFKPTATAFVSKFRELTAILEEHGRYTRMLTTTDPGIIRYEDDFQVIASSWKF